MHRHAMASSSSSSLNHLLFLLLLLTISFSLYNPRSSSAAAAIVDDSNLKHLHARASRKDSFLLSTHKDSLRVQSLFSRIISTAATTTTKTKTKRISTDPPPDYLQAAGKKQQQQVIATLESGVSLGSGEYLMDVFIGTPPRHFSLILDTGSDLNWLQCAPCRDCFPQRGPLYDPNLSSTYRNLTCRDHSCALVSPPPPDDDDTSPSPCGRDDDHDRTCQYFYWYGDQSNTTGDLAAEAFTVNLTAGNSHLQVDGVVFGCGHWNRGLFRGAAGLLGLGRGPLSFASQLRSLYGHHTFSYCLVDRNSDLLVTSKLVFGGEDDVVRPDIMNYTSFAAAGKDNHPADTFYYVRVKGVRVGGEPLPVPPESWELAEDGTGGTIIDSGTTLTYFVRPAYRAIREAFARKVTYPLVEDFPVLNPCYNVSGVAGEEVEMPGFGLEFADGAVWDFPAENYFIRLEPEAIMCLAFLETPRSSLSIIGNYQQQNFRILYDNKRSRLGFAPTKCSEV
ncbi:uncharacterized protein M6B38_338805 [Iris pallida]|uniref:Peptidase A1 domain-containing protein n=1 Tax=Iris pallida TaxID=29817 RepID=A0AAX6GZ46_IRIPA|nr:uncharacterized protein M6B38_338805 [Iris pallida]